MFKILTYKQFESQQEEFYWKEIPKPDVYPSTNHSNNWIETYMSDILGEDGNGNDVKFGYKDWDHKTHDYEVDEIEKKIIDLYQSDGKIYLVADDYKTYEMITDIEVKVKGKRLFTNEDPYGEEVWESFDIKIGDNIVCGLEGNLISGEIIKKFKRKYGDSDVFKVKYWTPDGNRKFGTVPDYDIHKIIRNVGKNDPYGEEISESYEVNEIFDTEKTYPYQFVTKRSWMKPFVDHVYKFTSRDNITYYVTLSLNTDWGRASIKFTDEANYKGIMNKIKDKYVNLDMHDAINVLNTVFKIGKDYYEKFKDQIKEVTTNTLDEKRLSIYKYLFGKYFKGWKMNSYTDRRGEFVIEFKPPK